MSFLKKLFGPPNVNRLQVRGDVRGLLSALGYDKEAVRQAAAQALVEMGKAKQAVEALRNVDTSQAIAPLLVILNSADREASMSASIVLERLGWEGSASQGSGGQDTARRGPGHQPFGQYPLMAEEEVNYRASTTIPRSPAVSRSETASRGDAMPRRETTRQGERAPQYVERSGSKDELLGEVISRPGGMPRREGMPRHEGMPRSERMSRGGGVPHNEGTPYGGSMPGNSGVSQRQGLSQGQILPVSEVSRPGIAPADGLASLGGFTDLAEARKDRGPVTKPLGPRGSSAGLARDESQRVERPVRGLSGPIQVRRAVEELVQISARYPDDIWATPEEGRVAAIGRDLHNAGGLRLMRMVYYQYMDRLPQVSQEAFDKGWCRNLHRWWTGIGEWGR